MSQRVLILDIKDDRVQAGLFTATDMEPDGFFTHPITAEEGQERGEALGEALSTLVATLQEEGHTHFHKILAGIPAGDLTLRVLSLPFEEEEKIREVLPFEVGNLLPRDVDEMVIDGIPLGAGRLMAVAVEKRLIGDYLDILQACGLDPYWLGVTLFSLDELLREIDVGETTRGIIREDSLAVFSPGKFNFFKSLSELDDITLALGYLDGEGVRLDTCHVTGWPLEEVASRLPSSTVSPLILPFDYPAEGAGILSLALRLKKGREGGINFRRGEFACTREREAARRGLTVTVVLALLIVLLLAGNLSLHYFHLAKDLTMTRENLRTAYRDLFPREGIVVDELYQLESRLKETKEKLKVTGSGLQVLDILTIIARAGKESGSGTLTLHKLSMGEGRLTARGEIESFEGATKLRNALRNNSLFKEVTLTDVTAAGGEDRTRFSLSLAINGGTP